MVFTEDRTPLDHVTSFKYLRRILTAADGDWPEVVSNLRKARRKWTQLTRVLGREGRDACTSGQIYLAVVLSVILYGSETWVINPHIGRVLGGFHHRVACMLTGRQPQQGRDGMWKDPLLEDAMTEAVLQEMETYVSLRHNTVTQFIATRAIMNLCLAEERRPGPRFSRRWWYQYRVDVEGMRTAAWDAGRT